MLNDFERLNLAQILRANFLEFFVTIKEQVYPDLVSVFYSNLSFRENVIQFCANNVNIDISLEGFARILHLSYEGADIFHLDFNHFEYPDGVRLLSPLSDYSMMIIIQPW